MASSNIDISGLDYLNNTDYAMSSGLEDWNDEEKMNKLLAALAADEVPEIRDTPNETMFNRVINRVSPTEPSVYGVGAPLGFPGQLDHRIFQPPSGPGMLTPALGRDLNSRMDSGLDYLNPKEKPPSQAYPTMDKLGAGFYAPTKPTEKEPELFGTALKALGKIFGGQPGEKGGGPTPWDVAAMGVGGIPAVALRRLFFNKKNGMFKDVFKNTEFKPWALDKFEDRMNEAPLLERWAAQMKEQIGWQSMTPDERRDYIKNNKHDKNNHIIMHYNMYRRR